MRASCRARPCTLSTCATLASRSTGRPPFQTPSQHWSTSGASARPRDSACWLLPAALWAPGIQTAYWQSPWHEHDTAKNQTDLRCWPVSLSGAEPPHDRVLDIAQHMVHAQNHLIRISILLADVDHLLTQCSQHIRLRQPRQMSAQQATSRQSSPVCVHRHLSGSLMATPTQSTLSRERKGISHRIVPLQIGLRHRILAIRRRSAGFTGKCIRIRQEQCRRISRWNPSCHGPRGGARSAPPSGEIRAQMARARFRGFPAVRDAAAAVPSVLK